MGHALYVRHPQADGEEASREPVVAVVAVEQRIKMIGADLFHGVPLIQLRGSKISDGRARAERVVHTEEQTLDVVAGGVTREKKLCKAVVEAPLGDWVDRANHVANRRGRGEGDLSPGLLEPDEFV